MIAQLIQFPLSIQLQEGKVLSPPLSPTENLLNAVRETHYPLGSQPCLSNFVINTLFNALAAATCLPLNESMTDFRQRSSKLEVWFKSYR